MWMKLGRCVRIEANGALSSLPSPKGIRRDVYVCMYVIDVTAECYSLDISLSRIRAVFSKEIVTPKVYMDDFIDSPLRSRIQNL